MPNKMPCVTVWLLGTYFHHMENFKIETQQYAIFHELNHQNSSQLIIKLWWMLILEENSTIFRWKRAISHIYWPLSLLRLSPFRLPWNFKKCFSKTKKTYIQPFANAQQHVELECQLPTFLKFCFFLRFKNPRILSLKFMSGHIGMWWKIIITFKIFKIWSTCNVSMF